MNAGELSLALKELRDAVIFFNRAGRGVKLDGLGSYLPKVGLDGAFSVSHRLDRSIKNALNSPGTFTGDLIRRGNIGKSADDLVALWDADHPDDPIA